MSYTLLCLRDINRKYTYFEKSLNIIMSNEQPNNKPSEPTMEMLKEEANKLNEFWLPEVKLSWAGKLFFASVAAYLGYAAYKGVNASQEEQVPKLPIKLKGTKEQIKAIMDVITSSAEFQKEVNKPGATVEDVIQKLNLKNINKASFEKVFNKKWPL